MKIKKGTELRVNHCRKGKFIGEATEDFDTDKNEFYPIKKTDRFNNIYFNLRHGLRNEIAAVVNDKPLTFKEVHEEIKKKTTIGYKAVDKMIAMKII